MAVVGASLSPDERDRVTAKLWFDMVEEIVFDDEIFSDHDTSNIWNNSGPSQYRQLHLEVLQAAYCVCLYQTWEGCRKSKRRVLRQRFSEIVYVSGIILLVLSLLIRIKVARDIGLSKASLRDIKTDSLGEFSWEEYILHESLIRYVHSQWHVFLH